MVVETIGMVLGALVLGCFVLIAVAYYKESELMPWIIALTLNGVLMISFRILSLMVEGGSELTSATQASLVKYLDVLYAIFSRGFVLFISLAALATLIFTFRYMIDEKWRDARRQSKEDQ